MDIKLYFSLWWSGVLIPRMAMMTWKYLWSMDMRWWVQLAEIMPKWQLSALINFNPSIDDFNHVPGKVWDEIADSFPSFSGCTVEVWEWVSNFLSHFIIDVIFGKFFFRILQLCTRLLSSYDSDVGPFCSRLQLCTRFPSSYVSDLGPFCFRQLRGLPSSDGYFSWIIEVQVFGMPNVLAMELLWFCTEP